MQEDKQELSGALVQEAAQLFYESTGVSFSDHSLRDFFSSFAEDMGPEKVIASADEMARRIDEASGKRRLVLVVATEGALMPTRPKPGRDTKRGPGEYKEAKSFRIYLNSGDRIVHLASSYETSSDSTNRSQSSLSLKRFRLLVF